MVTGYDPISSTEMIDTEAAMCVVEHKPLHWSDDGDVADLVGTARQSYAPLVAPPSSLWSRLSNALFDLFVMALLFLPLVLTAFGVEIHR